MLSVNWFGTPAAAERVAYEWLARAQHTSENQHFSEGNSILQVPIFRWLSRPVEMLDNERGGGGCGGHVLPDRLSLSQVWVRL